MIVLPQSALHEILDHGHRCLPEESCGLLAGHRTEGIYRVEQVVPIENIAHAENRFLLDPIEQMNAIKRIRLASMELIGNWHTHPHAPPVPSALDLAFACDPQLCYMILSLQNKPILRTYRLSCRSLAELPIEIR